MATVNEIAKCLCGAVNVQIEGPLIFSHYCHCRACCLARGTTPVHLVALKGDPKVLQGQVHLRTVPGMGRMTHSFCCLCGTGLFQRPVGSQFYASFPTTFQIETETAAGCSPSSSMLPPHLQPTCHCNYENRLADCNDDLIKYKTFAPYEPIPGAGIRMTNDGTILEETDDTLA